MDLSELKRFIVDVIEEEFGPRPTEIGPRWAGGTLILKPNGDTQPKDVPLEVFFKKLLGIRDSLRVLEQKINANEQLSAEDKATFHGYITKCYGSLTTFNILFKNDKDKFVGSGSGPAAPQEKLTMAEAKRRLGLREHGE